MMRTTVGSRIILDNSALNALDKAQMTALSMTADAFKTELQNAGVMPFLSGTMQNDNNTTVDDSKCMSGTVSIVTSAPQARRLYYHPEYHFTKKDNPNAGGKWFERFDTVDSVSVIYKKMFKMLGGL